MAKPSQSTSSWIYSTCRTPTDHNAPIPCIGTLPGGAQHLIPEGAFIMQRWLVKQRAILLMLCAIKSQYRFIIHLVHLVTYCSAGSDTMQILSDIKYPRHAHARKSSSPISAYHRRQAKMDVKHHLPEKMSSTHQHSGPVKSNLVFTFAWPCVW